VHATLKDVLEIGDAGPRGLHVTGTIRRDEAECVLDPVGSVAENLSVRFALQDQDLKKLTVMDGVLGQIGKVNVTQAQKELGSVHELALLKSATDLTEKQDPVTDLTQCHLFLFPLQCQSMLLWALASADSFLELL
jgi:hypothetical protein